MTRLSTKATLIAAVILSALATTANYASANDSSLDNPAVADDTTVNSAIKWLETQHSFGVINEADGRVSCSMRMVNISDSAIAITDVRTSCGCTSVNYPHQPIAPGDTAIFTVTYNPAGLPGDFIKDVNIRLSAEPRRTRISIFGRVIATPTTVNQRFPLKAGSLGLKHSLMTFGKVERGTANTLYLHGYNAGDAPLAITVDDASTGLFAEVVTDTVEPGANCIIAVKVDSNQCPNNWGPTDFSFRILAVPTITDTNALAGVARVKVVANLYDNFSYATEEQLASSPIITLSEDKLDFGSLGSGSAIRDLVITNDGHTPLSIHRIISDAPEAISISVDNAILAPGQSILIEVSASIPENQEFLNASLTIYSNDMHNPMPTCRIVGTK